MDAPKYAASGNWLSRIASGCPWKMKSLYFSGLNGSSEATGRRWKSLEVGNWWAVYPPNTNSNTLFIIGCLLAHSSVENAPKSATTWKWMYPNNSGSLRKGSSGRRSRRFKSYHADHFIVVCSDHALGVSLKSTLVQIWCEFRTRIFTN